MNNMAISKKQLVLQTLQKLYRELKRPIKVTEVFAELQRHGYDISERWVRKVLEQYAKGGYVVKIGGRPTFYMPAKRLNITPLTEFIGKRGSSEEISGRIELKEADYTEQVAAHILRILRGQPEILKKVEEHALEIAECNPVNETLELVHFLCKSLYSQEITANSKMYQKVIRQVEKLVKRWLGSVLGVPFVYLNPKKVLAEHDKESLCGSADEDLLGKVAAIGIGVRSGIGVRGPTAVLAYNEKRLRQYLETRFTDDKLIIEIDIVNPDRMVYISGHDTSYWPIKLSLPIEGVPSFTEVYILSGVRYSTWLVSRGTEVHYVAEVAPDPSSLAQLRHRDAVEHGYLITPDIIEESEERVSRIVEAAMNILEYQLMLNSIMGAVSGGTLRLESSGFSGYDLERPMPPPKPIFHDGRLFPYEHKLADYVGGYGDWHSRLVRISVSRFRDIIRHVMGSSTEEPDLLIVGVVKRGRAPTIHSLIIWALRKLKAIDDKAFWDKITQWLYERYEVTALFRGIVTKRRLKDKTLRTVGVIRRYWAMDEELMKAYTDYEYGAKSIWDEYSEEFWLNEPVFDRTQIREGEERGLRGYLSIRGVEANADKTLAYVLANATIVLTYILPPPKYFAIEKSGNEIEFALPRYEVLIHPLSVFSKDLSKEEGLAEAVKSYRAYVNKVINSLALPRIPERGLGVRLFAYEITGIEESLGNEVWTIQTIVPLHIHQADEFSKRYDEQLRTLYTHELFIAIKRIMEASQTEAVDVA